MYFVLIALLAVTAFAQTHPDDNNRPDAETRYEPLEVLSSEASGAVTSLWRGITITHNVEADGTAVVEGDIILSHMDEGKRAKENNGNHNGHKSNGRNDAIIISGSRYRWPKGTMPYVINSTTNATVLSRIMSAINYWNSVLPANVRLVPRTNETGYVLFYNTSSNICSSSIGMTGYVQRINIGPYCSVGNTIHEIGHAFGLWHEQSREDRNNYVQVLWENVQTGQEHNFNQKISNGDDIGPYDFTSIMHYPAYAFSKNGLPTLKTIPTPVSLGYRTTLSDKDIAAIRFMYP
jgi:hypothetical protein